MKKAIFTAVVFLAAAYAYYDFQSEQRAEQKKADTAVLLPWDHTQIDSFKIEKGENSLELKKTDGKWQLLKPLQDQVSEEDVLTFLEGLTTEKSINIVTEGTQIDYKVFGLDQPLAHITVQKGADVQVFHVGSKKNFEGNSYLRLNEEPRVVVAAATWQNKTDKTAYDFRDKRWARLDVKSVESMSLQAGKEKTELVKKDENWTYKNHPDWKLDQNKIRPFLASLSENRIQKFSVPLDSKTPFATIRLGLSGGKKWEGQLFINNEKKHVLSVPAEKLTGEILPSEVDNFYKISEDSIRDRKAAFAIAADKVQKFEIKSPDRNWKFERKGESWVLEPMPEGRELDPSKINQLITEVGNMEVLQFTDKKQDPGLTAKSSKLIFKNAEDKVILELNWGVVRGLDINGSKFAVVPVTSSLHPQVVLVAESRIEAVDFNSVFKSQPGALGAPGTEEKK